jgi:hypothetical protein
MSSVHAAAAAAATNAAPDRGRTQRRGVSGRRMAQRRPGDAGAADARSGRTPRPDVQRQGWQGRGVDAGAGGAARGAEKERPQQGRLAEPKCRGR